MSFFGKATLVLCAALSLGAFGCAVDTSSVDEEGEASDALSATPVEADALPASHLHLDATDGDEVASEVSSSDGDDDQGPDPTPWHLSASGEDGEEADGDGGLVEDGEEEEGPDPTPWHSDELSDDQGPDPTPWEPDPQPWRQNSSVAH